MTPEARARKLLDEPQPCLIRLPTQDRQTWYTDHLAALIAEAIRAAEVESLARCVRAVCPHCHPGHSCVLEDSQVWGFCGAYCLIEGGIPEEDVIAAIRTLPARPTRKPL